MVIWIINGPNLNLLGKREISIYGDTSFDEYLNTLRESFPSHKILHYQSNHEGSIIDKLQEVHENADGIILNSAAYTHTSIAIADCVAAIDCPVVEVHISNIEKREKFRKKSFLKKVCEKTIQGKGLKGYNKAVHWLIKNKS